MKKLKLTLLLSFFCFTISINAQSNLKKEVSDSLWSVWENVSEADTNRIKAIHKYAWSGYLFSQPDSAFYFATLMKDFSEKNNHIRYIGVSLNMMGIAKWVKGEFDEAVNYSESALKYYEKGNDTVGIASVIGSIGSIYLNSGHYAKSYGYFKRGMTIFEKLNNNKGISKNLNNIGLIHYYQGDFETAISYFNKSLAIKIELGDIKGQASSLGNLGLVYGDMGKFDVSLDYNLKCLKIQDSLGDKFGASNSLDNIGITYAYQNNHKMSLNYFNQSLELKKVTKDQRGIAITYNNIANSYFYTSDFSKSFDFGVKSHEISNEIKSNRTIKDASNIIYRSSLKILDISTSYKYLSAILFANYQDLDNNYFALSENEKELFFSTLEPHFNFYHDFALHHGKQFAGTTDTAFNISLQNKGLTLKSSTAMRQSIQNSEDATLIDEYDSWLDLKKQIAKSYESGKEIKELENQANQIERELVKKSNVFSDFDKIKNLDWKQVQAGLKSNEAAIEFVHFKSEIDTAHPIIYAALIVKKDSEHPEMIKLCNEEDLKEILGVFQGNNLSFVNKVYGTKSKAQKALYQKIWQPMEDHLQGIKNIYYSPSGLLHKVSFATISKDDKVFLCDAYQLHQQSSTGKLAFPNNLMYEKSDQFMLIGGVQYNSTDTKNNVWSYLPGTQSEVQQISNFLTKQKHSIDLYTSLDANEGNIKEKAQKANVLHFSTHGFFYPDPEQVRAEIKEETLGEDIFFRGDMDTSDLQRKSNYANWSFVINKNPLMRSGLVLAGANDVWQRNAMEEGEDGILTAQEVSNLDLRNTKLVVLSACETGLGDIKGSEGVFGLQRAFKMAGAEYLIMSLWQVPDKETAEFMELFYKNLVKVKDIPKAFNLTQQVMRKKYDPYYWAAFVLIN